MDKTNGNNIDGDTLSIFCIDSLCIKDKVTFYDWVAQGMHVTYWQEDTEDESKIIDAMFDSFFEEVLKTRSMRLGKSEDIN